MAGLLVTCEILLHLTGARILLSVPLAFPNPALTTAGIVLRHLEAGDIPWMAMACNDRELSRYVPVFGKLGIERLHLVTAPENVASQRVAERAGS